MTTDHVNAQVAALRQEIEELETVAKAEDELAKAKAKHEPGSEKLREVKDKVRAARAAYRSGRAAGTADPDTIEAAVTAEED